MKDDRDLNKSNSGHTSRILDGLADTDRKTYSELQGSNPGAVAAFSKGIIQREHQKEAVILTDYTAQNPFDQVPRSCSITRTINHAHATYTFTYEPQVA